MTDVRGEYVDDIQARIRKLKMLLVLRKIWSEEELSRYTEVRIFNTNVMSIFH